MHRTSLDVCLHDDGSGGHTALKAISTDQVAGNGGCAEGLFAKPGDYKGAEVLLEKLP